MRTSSFLGPMWSIMVVLILCAITSVNSYSKYGRGCVDIGCLPNEVCVLSHDSCGFGQRDGKECGSYPTCKKSGAAPANSGGAKPSASHSNSYQTNGGNSNGNTNNYANNNNNGNANANNGGGNNGGSGSNGNRNNPNSPIDPHYVFGAPYSQPIIPNMPIFPFNHPTQPPAFQQFPQPNHPSSGLSPAFPQNIQPVNPYNPPFIFGQQPYFNPGGTGGPPGSLAPGGGSGIGLGGLGLGGYNNPNMFNKPPPQYLPNQNPYNRQTQSHPSSAAGGVHHGATTSSGLVVVVVGGLLSLSSVSGGLSMVTDGLVLGLAMLQQRMARHLLRT